jgi:hypothetical protein
MIGGVGVWALPENAKMNVMKSSEKIVFVIEVSFEFKKNLPNSNPNRIAL